MQRDSHSAAHGRLRALSFLSSYTGVVSGARRGGQGRPRRTSGTWTCSRRTGCGPHLGRPAQTPRPPWPAGPAGVVASYERHVDMLGSLRSRRAGVRPTLGPPGADSPPNVAGRGGRVARAARGRARLAATATLFRPTWSALLRVAEAPCPPWRAGAAASHERHMDLLATNRVQPTLGQPGADPPTRRGRQARQGWSRRTSGTWTCSAPGTSSSLMVHRSKVC
jgi:hypothetical protein